MAFVTLGLHAIFAPMSLWAVAPACGPTLPGWRSARTDPSPSNVLIIQRGRAPAWNGSPVNAEQVREYLGLTKAIKPVAPFILVVTPNPDCDEVRLYRDLADGVLDCDSGQCVEVGL